MVGGSISGLNLSQKSARLSLQSTQAPGGSKEKAKLIGTLHLLIIPTFRSSFHGKVSGYTSQIKPHLFSRQIYKSIQIV